MNVLLDWLETSQICDIPENDKVKGAMRVFGFSFSVIPLFMAIKQKMNKMAQDQKCCSKLSEMLQNELRVLLRNSFLICFKKNQERQIQCLNWYPFFRWICFLWSFIRLMACLSLALLIISYWTTMVFTAISTCKSLGAAFSVTVLNQILKINLKNNLQLGFGINTPPNPSMKPGWGLPIFEDTFQGSTLDTTKWRKTPEWIVTSPYAPFHPGNIKDKGIAPKEYYADSAITVNNGLKLKISKYPQIFQYIDWDGTNYGSWTIDYKTGHIETINPYKQRYGYFEIRCKMGNSKGVWPAFWLAEGVTWPPEIDIFEMFSTKSFYQFESNYHWGIKDTSDSKTHDINDTTREFHIYACEWDTCFLKWYYDNMLVRVAYDHVKSVNDDFAIVISTGVDDLNGDYRIDLDEDKNAFEVEYVRAYQK